MLLNCSTLDLSAHFDFLYHVEKKIDQIQTTYTQLYNTNIRKNLIKKIF